MDAEGESCPLAAWKTTICAQPQASVASECIFPARQSGTMLATQSHTLPLRYLAPLDATCRRLQATSLALDRPCFY